MLQAFLKDDSGATAIEYGLIAALVSVAAIATLTSLGDTVQAVFAQVDDGLQIASGTPPVEVPGDIVVLEPVLQPVLDGDPIAIQ
jgi:pilus assembly protein Flp/PilA